MAAEASAGAILLDYWKTGVHTAIWITIILVLKANPDIAANYLEAFTYAVLTTVSEGLKRADSIYRSWKKNPIIVNLK